jgi:hypothetical protein
LAAEHAGHTGAASAAALATTPLAALTAACTAPIITAGAAEQLAHGHAAAQADLHFGLEHFLDLVADDFPLAVVLYLELLADVIEHHFLEVRGIHVATAAESAATASGAAGLGEGLGSADRQAADNACQDQNVFRFHKFSAPLIRLGFS